PRPPPTPAAPPEKVVRKIEIRAYSVGSDCFRGYSSGYSVRCREEIGGKWESYDASINVGGKSMFMTRKQADWLREHEAYLKKNNYKCNFTLRVVTDRKKMVTAPPPGQMITID
ncbi:hypothetical protein ACFL2T_07385, partial [Elusimicrobiota bacterium]